MMNTGMESRDSDNTDNRKEAICFTLMGSFIEHTFSIYTASAQLDKSPSSISSQDSSTTVADGPWFPELWFPTLPAWFLISCYILKFWILSLYHSQYPQNCLLADLTQRTCQSLLRSIFCSSSEKQERPPLVLMKNRETQDPIDTEPFFVLFCMLFPSGKQAGPYGFAVTATFKKASCFSNRSNKIQPKSLDVE